MSVLLYNFLRDNFFTLQDPFRAQLEIRSLDLFTVLYTVTMDDDTITRSNGQRYAYDADFDVYRRVPEPQELTHMSQYGWIYISVFALALSVYMTL